MVAVLTPRTSPYRQRQQPVGRPSLRIVTDRDRARPVPVGVAPLRRSAARYRRRRVAAALVALTTVALAVLVVVNVAARIDGLSAGAGTVHAGLPAASLAGAAPVSSASYVVKPGDTAWAIARKLQPSGDVRPLVDKLVDRQGGAVLQAGQRIDLTGLVG